MSSIIIVLPKIEDAKKIKKILMQHGFDNIISCTTGASCSLFFTHGTDTVQAPTRIPAPCILTILLFLLSDNIL